MQVGIRPPQLQWVGAELRLKLGELRCLELVTWAVQPLPHPPCGFPHRAPTTVLPPPSSPRLALPRSAILRRYATVPLRQHQHRQRQYRARVFVSRMPSAIMHCIVAEDIVCPCEPWGNDDKDDDAALRSTP